MTLLDAGSANFFAGSRRAQGKVVMTAARKALCRRDGVEEEEEDDEESGSSRSGDSPKDVSDPDGAQRHRRPSQASKDGKDVSGGGHSCPPPGAQCSSSSGSGAGGGKIVERKEEDQHTIDKLVSAFAGAGLLALCIQLWEPARDGDHQSLARLLELDPWTIDEPGRAGQGYTNALQVACAGGHVQCVELLLSKGAIFRDSDWQPTPHPFVCASMLVGAGYYDQGGGA